MGKLVISIEFAAEELKLEEKAHTPKGVALCFMHFRPLLLPLSTGSEKFHFRGRGKAMLLEVEWPEVRQMAKRAPFWLLLLDQTWQVMGSTCFDLGAQIARAAAAGVAERETEMDSFGLLTAQMLSTHGNQQVASLDCAFRVGCIRDASYTSNASVGDVKDKLRELPKVVEAEGWASSSVFAA
ncbi:unnamed protein product [Durusdinium trenchii]|uniref:Uncharacterized protein n=1 Tax=Durusdinium trenchii TaxID=1381693 RepID=A0ABP0QK87_9DINO